MWNTLKAATFYLHLFTPALFHSSMDFGAQNTNSRSEIFPRCGGPTLGLPAEIRQQIFQHLLTDHSSHKWRGLRTDGKPPERLYIRPNQHVIHYKFKTRRWIVFGDYSSRSQAPVLKEEVSSYFYDGFVKRTIQPQILRVCSLWLREGVCILYGGSGGFITLNTPTFIHKFLPDIGQVDSGNIRELKICLKIAAQVLPDDRISEGDTLQLLNGQEAVKESFPRAIERLLRMGCLPELRKLELETLRSDGSLILTYPENNRHLDRFRGCLLQSTKIALKSERFRKVAWIERTSELGRREVVHIRVTF